MKKEKQKTTFWICFLFYCNTCYSKKEFFFINCKVDYNNIGKIELFFKHNKCPFLSVQDLDNIADSFFTFL